MKKVINCIFNIMCTIAITLCLATAILLIVSYVQSSTDLFTDALYLLGATVISVFIFDIFAILNIEY